MRVYSDKDGDNKDEWKGNDDGEWDVIIVFNGVWEREIRKSGV